MKRISQLFFTLLFCSYVTGIKAQVIITLAGNGTSGYAGDGGVAATSQLNSPTNVTLDASGNLYVADFVNHRIRKISSNGIITTVAGNGIGGFTGDGGVATAAKINFPSGIAIDAAGNIYIADCYNHRIRKVNNSTGIISTVAGNGAAGYVSDGSAATSANGSLYFPSGVAVDATGNLYIADKNNNRIRKVNTSGIISTLAGTGIAGYSGDGSTATAAKIFEPTSVAVDPTGNIYISDYGNNCIRKITVSSGNISTIAGTGIAGYSGDGGVATAAKLHGPFSVALDASNNIYIADDDNNRIRMISSSTGNISTYAGTGVAGFSGDNGLAVSAKLNLPTGIAISNRGIAYIADSNNNRIRKIFNNHAPYFVNGHTQYDTVCQNTTYNTINTLLSANDTDLMQNITWSVVSSAHLGSVGGSFSTYSTGISTTPSGFLYTPTYGASGTDSFKIAVSDGIAQDTVTIYITIKQLPNAGTILGSASVCLHASVLLSDAAPGGSWSATNSNATIVSGSLTGVNSGYDTIKYTVINSCGTAVTSKTIIVRNLPFAGTISGSATFCQSTVDTLINSGITDAYYNTYLYTNSHSTIVHSSSNYYINGTTGGTDTLKIVVTSLYGCGNDTAIKSITINPLVVPGTISGATNVCVGLMITLSDTATGGIWSSRNATIATVGSTGIVTGISNGTDTISYTKTNSCGSLSATKVINVHALPHASHIYDSTSTLCVASHTTYLDTTTGGSWYRVTGNASVSSTGVVTGISPGVDTIKYVVTSTYGCRPDTAKISITINPLPYGRITGPIGVCVGDSVVLRDSVLGTGVWSIFNHFAASLSGMSQDSVIVHGIAGTSSTHPDTVKLTVSNSCGTIVVKKVFNIYAIPNAGVINDSASDRLCVNTHIYLYDTTSGGYWIRKNTLISLDSPGTGRIYANGAGIDTIGYVLLSTHGCLNDTVYKTITIDPLPNAGIISGNSKVCVAVLDTFTASITGGSWYLINHKAHIYYPGVVHPDSIGTDTLLYVISNRCGIDTATKIITVNPTPFAGVINGGNTICTGSKINLSDTLSTGTGHWGTSNSNININTSGQITGISSGIDTIFYILDNACRYTYSSRVITVNPLPNVVPIDIFPNSLTFCKNTLYQNFGSNTAPASDIKYTWTSTNAEVFSGTHKQSCIVSFHDTGTAIIKITSKEINTGCMSYDSIFAHVTDIVSPNPVSVIYSSPTLICLDNTPIQYKWGYDIYSSLNPYVISGQVFQMCEQDTLNTITNKYWVETKYENGCMQKSYYNAPTNIIQLNENNIDVKIYPNPVLSSLNIEVLGAKNADILFMKISDITGREVKSELIIDGKSIIDFSEQTSGLYFVEIMQNGIKVNTKKIIKY